MDSGPEQDSSGVIVDTVTNLHIDSTVDQFVPAGQRANTMSELHVHCRSIKDSANELFTRNLQAKKALAAQLPTVECKYVSDQHMMVTLMKAYPEFNLKSTAVVNAVSHPFARQKRFLDYEYAMRCFVNYSHDIKLLSAYDNTPFDMFVKDVGMMPSIHLKHGRDMVHCCNPVLGIKDTSRFHADKRTMCVSSARVSTLGTRQHAMVMSLLRDDGSHSCGLLGQHCEVTAPYVLFVHSAYDIQLCDFVAILDKSKCEQALVVMHFHPNIFVYNSGVLPDLDCRFKKYSTPTGEQRIRFTFDRDSSLSYDHNWHTYVSLLVRNYLVSSDGSQRYHLDHDRMENSTIYIKVSRSYMKNEQRAVCFRSIPFNDMERMVVVHTWRFDTLLSTQDSLEPIRLVVPQRLYDKILQFALCCGPGKFTLTNIQTAATAFNTREVINGMSVGPTEKVDPVTLTQLVMSVYVKAYILNFEMTQSVEKLTEEEKKLRDYNTSGFFKKFYYLITNRVPKGKYVNGVVSDGTTIEYQLGNLKFEESYEWRSKSKWYKNFLAFLMKGVDLKADRPHPIFIHAGTRVLTIEEELPEFISDVPPSHLPFIHQPSLKDAEVVMDKKLIESCFEKEFGDVELPSQTIVTGPAKTYTVVPVVGDGDCFFHCLIKGLNMAVSPRVVRERLIASKFVTVLSTAVKDKVKHSLAAQHGTVDSWADIDVALVASGEYNVNILVHANCETTADSTIVSSHTYVSLNDASPVKLHIRHQGTHFDLLSDTNHDFSPIIFECVSESSDMVAFEADNVFEEMLNNNSFVLAKEGAPISVYADIAAASLMYCKQNYHKNFGFSSGYALLLHAALHDMNMFSKRVLSVSAKDGSSLEYLCDAMGADVTACYFQQSNQVTKKPYTSARIKKFADSKDLRKYLCEQITLPHSYSFVIFNPSNYCDKLQPLDTGKYDTYLNNYIPLLRFLELRGTLLIAVPYSLSNYMVHLVYNLKKSFETTVFARTPLLPDHSPWVIVKFHNLIVPIDIESLVYTVEEKVSADADLIDVISTMRDVVSGNCRAALESILEVKQKVAVPETLTYSEYMGMQVHAPTRTASSVKLRGGATPPLSFSEDDIRQALGKYTVLRGAALEKVERFVRIKLVDWAFKVAETPYDLTSYSVSKAYHNCNDRNALAVLYLAYTDLQSAGHLRFDVNVSRKTFSRTGPILVAEVLDSIIKDFSKWYLKAGSWVLPKVKLAVEALAPKPVQPMLIAASEHIVGIPEPKVVQSSSTASFVHRAIYNMHTHPEYQKICTRDDKAAAIVQSSTGYIDTLTSGLARKATKADVPTVQEVPDTTPGFDMTYGGLLPVSGNIKPHSDHCFDDFSYTSKGWMQDVVDDYLQYEAAEVYCVTMNCCLIYDRVLRWMEQRNSNKSVDTERFLFSLLPEFENFVLVTEGKTYGKSKNIGRYVFAWDNTTSGLFRTSQDADGNLVCGYTNYFSFDKLAVLTNKDIRDTYQQYKIKRCYPKGGGLIQAAAGCGKTHSIIQSCVALASNDKSFKILTSTREGCSDVAERLTQALESKKLPTVKNVVQTIDSFLIHGAEQKLDVLFIDEALMSHAGKLLLAIDKVDTQYVRAYGDRMQIPFINRLPANEFVPTLYDPRKVFPVLDVLYISHRVPVDVAALLDDAYLEMNREMGLDKGMHSINTTVPSYSLELISNVGGIPKLRGTKVLTMTQSDKQCLIDNGHKDVNTVHEFQGKESNHVALVRLNSHEMEIFKELNHCVTALTRHKVSFRYYTVRSSASDLIRDFMKIQFQLQDEKVQKVLELKGGADVNVVLSERTVSHYVDQNNWTVNHCAYIPTKFLPKGCRLVKESKSGLVETSYNTIRIPSHIPYSELKVIADRLPKMTIAVADDHFTNISGPTVAKVLKERGHEVIRTGDNNSVIRSQVFDAATVSGIQGQPVKQPVYVDPVVLTYSEPKVEVNVSCADIVSHLQSMVNNILPGTTFVDTYYDQWMLHNSDYEINVGPLRYGNVFTATVSRNFDTMRPVLRMPVPHSQKFSSRHLLHAIAKRNANPPKLTTVYSISNQVNDMVSLFKRGAPNVSFDPVTISMQDMQQWANNQPGSVLNAIVPDMSVLTEMALNEYDIIIKSNPKPDMTVDCLDSYPAPQTILYQKKCINAIFCTLWGTIRDRVLDGLDKRFLFFTKMRDSDLSDWLNSRLPDGICALLNKWEVDMKKFDKSQNELVLAFEAAVLRLFGVPEQLVTLWVNAHRYTRIFNRESGISFELFYQRKSGDASTFFGNTLFLFVALLSVFDFDDIVIGMFAGDDSYIVTRSDTRPQLQELAYKYNLEAKVFRFHSAYFCSKFLVHAKGRWHIVPDPMKRAIKLGRTDLVNPDHVEEYRVSFSDNVKVYNDYEVARATSECMKERYGCSYDSTFAILCMGALQDPSLFHGLFYTSPGDVLCLDPSRPSLEL